MHDQLLNITPVPLGTPGCTHQGAESDQIAAISPRRLRRGVPGQARREPVWRVPDRHQTQRAALDWSHDPLSGEEKTLLRRLAAFAGGWMLEAAEVVCAGGGIEAGDVLAMLARLVDQSLIQAEEQGGQVRYCLLDTIWQYAHQRLATAEHWASSSPR